MIPPMLIQPFIENAVEHAFINKKEDKEITINMHLKNEELICTITDNGIGINTSKTKNKNENTSLATTITTERLEILSKKHKTKGSLLIKNRENEGKNGTIVTITIPYKMVETLS